MSSGGLTCFRIDISQKEKSMVVLAAIGFLFYGGLIFVNLTKCIQLVYTTIQ